MYFLIYMEYKKLFRNRNLRIRILSWLTWIPDFIMIPLQYWIYTGQRLSFSTPKRFTEKIQLYKLKCHIPAMLHCTDKYEVRKYVKQKYLDKLLIPLIGIYSTTKEINFNSLPNQFVVKTTDGGGGNQVLICRNKSKLLEQEFYDVLNSWLLLPKPKKSAGREWAYENGYQRRIIIEELLTDGYHKDIPDYKFWCFHGVPRYCQVIGNRSEKETIDFFDMEWKHQSFRGLNKICNNADIPPIQPDKFEEMKDIARILSQEFPFVRVDLYQANGKVYFGELTFYPAGGYGHFTPDIYDNKLGNYLDISQF